MYYTMWHILWGFIPWFNFFFIYIWSWIWLMIMMMSSSISDLGQPWMSQEQYQVIIWSLHWHYISVLASQTTSKSTVWSNLIDANNKENAKGSYYWPFVRGIHCWLVEGQQCRKHVVMLSMKKRVLHRYKISCVTIPWIQIPWATRNCFEW